MAKDFVVDGYDISGRVISGAGGQREPVMGVDILLYSETAKSIRCSPVSIKPPGTLSYSTYSYSKKMEKHLFVELEVRKMENSSSEMCRVDNTHSFQSTEAPIQLST